jgi:uncharacterized protein with HEPN domain
MALLGRERLWHMFDEAEYLLGRSLDLTKEEFLENEDLRRAFVRSLEVMSEAAKRVPDETRARLHEIDWQRMTSMRDLVIHDPFHVDYDIVWNVVQEKLPALHQHLMDVLGSTRES